MSGTIMGESPFDLSFGEEVVILVELTHLIAQVVVALDFLEE